MYMPKRRKLAGQRPIAFHPTRSSDLGLFGHLERVVNVDAQVSDRTIKHDKVIAVTLGAYSFDGITTDTLVRRIVFYPYY